MKRVQQVLLALALAVIAVFGAQAQDARTYINPKTYALVPVFKSELERNFIGIPQPWYVLGLAEHESCISLKHSRCMSPTSNFSTKWAETGNRREYGAGLSMITRAWYKDGRVRMDTLANLKRVYPNELKELNWDNILERPDLQVRAMILLLREDYRALNIFQDEVERLKAADSSYNGGRRDVITAVKRCGMTKGCDPQIWFNHVEKHSPKSTEPMYGGRSAREINTHHVRDVFLTRMPKHQKLLPHLDKP